MEEETWGSWLCSCHPKAVYACILLRSAMGSSDPLALRLPRYLSWSHLLCTEVPWYNLGSGGTVSLRYCTGTLSLSQDVFRNPGPVDKETIYLIDLFSKWMWFSPAFWLKLPP